MNPIKSSIWYLLIYSKLFLVVLVVFILFAILINLTAELSYIKSIGLILQVFIFLGVYLGGALAKLKCNYLWHNNNNYKYSILHGYLIIIILVNLGFIPLLFSFTNISPLILAMPICTCVFASHMVLGKNLFYKIMIPAIPLGIFQLIKFGLNINIVLVLIVLVTMVLILFMYKNILYQYSKHKSTDKIDIANSIAFMTTGLSHKHMNKLNGFIGIVVSKWIMYGKRNLDWSVLMPHSRLAIFSLAYTLLLMIFMFIKDHDVQKVIGIFALTILPNIFLGLIMESRNLLKQTKFFSHVFTGEKHRQLKNKILFAMDKNMLINAIVFVVMIMLIIKILSINVPVTPLLLSMALVIGISLAIHPILMCLNWVNISLLLITILGLYVALLYKSITWIYKNPQLVTTLPYVIMFVISCIFLRIAAQYLFWQRPIESLLRTK